MAQKRKTVSYVVGATLDAPIVVTHVLPEEKEPKPQEKQKSGIQMQQSKKFETSDNAKRTCGHSQKDVRVKYQQRKKMK